MLHLSSLIEENDLKDQDNAASGVWFCFFLKDISKLLNNSDTVTDFTVLSLYEGRLL